MSCCLAVFAVLFVSATAAPAKLTVSTDFPGGSAVVEAIGQEARTISIRPGSNPGRGWECWWALRLTGLTPGEAFTLRVNGMDFARPERAAVSTDGKTWTQTPPGKADGKWVTYRLTAPAAAVHLAWGPPYQFADAQAAVKRAAAAGVGAAAFELCRSTDGRSIPALRWEPPKSPAGGRRPGIWVSARQHAWESGGSWVCQGFLDFLTSDDPAAKRLRETARIVVVPVMDVDNVERGAGGKNQTPHDHNRDWSDRPVWPEVAAAQKVIKDMDAAGECDLFLDLHNPAPGDRVPFFMAAPDTLTPPARQANQERFVALAADHLGREKLKFSPKPRISGPGYHPLWKQISKNWLAATCHERAVALTLETSWNTPHSTADGYRSYGRALGRAVAEYVTRGQPK